jgi:RNA polymerase sigma-70 factor, ECF subfamily
LAATFEALGGDPIRKLDFLQDCLRTLEGRARQLCDLRYQHDFKPAAIGEALGMTANSVAKALQRIRDQLRDCIERKAKQAGGII